MNKRPSKTISRRTAILSDDREGLTKEIEQEKKLVESEKKKDEETLKQAINLVAATDEGRILLKFVMDLSGHNKHKAVVNPQSGEINLQSTSFNLGRDSLWLTLKAKIQPKYLKLIEY